MTDPHYLLHIPTTVPIEILEAPPGPVATDTITDTVAGYFEATRPTIAGLDLVQWHNEEGKLKQLPHNPMATDIARNALFRGDWIAGDALLTVNDGEDVRAFTLAELNQVLAAIGLPPHTPRTPAQQRPAAPTNPLSSPANRSAPGRRPRPGLNP